MVMKAVRNTFFGTPTRSGIPTYVPEIVMKAETPLPNQPSQSAVVERMSKQLKSMNMDPNNPSTMQAEPEPVAMPAIEARAVARFPLIVPFIATRVRQFRQAGKRRLNESSLGYELVHMDPEKTLSAKQKRTAQAVYAALERGISMADKMELIGRDVFEIDRGVGEITWSAGGTPYAWDVWDGATMRWCVPTDGERERGRYSLNRPLAQWIDGVEKRQIPRKSSIVMIRNLRTDLWCMGYGFPEVEQAADDIVRGVQADTWNGSVFENGFGASFILKLKMKLGEDEFVAFQEQLQETMKGLKNAHRVGALLLSPKMQGMLEGEDIEKLDLGSNQKDMEYRFLLSYYYRRVAAAFGMDLEEIGMGDPGDTGKSTLSEQDSSWKIAMSRERGLAHALDKASDELTRQFVWPFDPDLRLVFNGLNALSPEKQAQLDAMVMQGMTYNQWLAYKNRPKVQITPGMEWADECPLHPLAVQLYMAGKASQQQPQPGMEGGAPGEGEQGAEDEPEQEPEPDGQDYGDAAAEDQAGQVGPTDDEADAQ